MLCKLPHVIFIIFVIQTTEHIPVYQNGSCIYYNFSFNESEENRKFRVRWWGDEYFSLITERISIFNGFENVIFGVSFEKNLLLYFRASSNGTMKSIFLSFINRIQFSISLFYLSYNFLLLPTYFFRRFTYNLRSSNEFMRSDMILCRHQMAHVFHWIFMIQ